MHGSNAKLEKLWSDWNDKFDKYLTFLNVQDSTKKRDILLRCAGDDVTDYLQVWSDASGGDYESIITTLNVSFRPKLNVRYERHKFHSCVQKSDETIDDYIIRLKRLAKTCKFDDLNDRIVEHFIEKSPSTMLRHILLREQDLDFETMLTIVRDFESNKCEPNAVTDDTRRCDRRIIHKKVKKWKKRNNENDLQ